MKQTAKADQASTAESIHDRPRTNAPGVLSGIRVLELSQFIAGPVCGCILADHGAEVIKIEPPDGEDARRIPPFVDGESLYFAVNNRNKVAMTLDLKKPEGHEIFLQLVESSDVVLENYRPGVMERLGLSFRELAEVNPNIILVSISGFGQTGPYRDLPAFDQIIQALTGVMLLSGHDHDEPMKMGISVSDYAGAAQGAIGALLALIDRHRTGKGQHVDVALFDSLTSMLETSVSHVEVHHEAPPRVGNGRPGSVPSNLYPCSDGWIYITGTTERIWLRLANLIGLPPEDIASKYSTNALRVRNRVHLDAQVASWARGFEVATLVERLTAAGIPCAPVRNVQDLLDDPQVSTREMLVQMNHPVLGMHRVPGIPVKLSKTPGAITKRSPGLGEQTESILSGLLGVDPERIKDFRRNGVV